MRELDREKPQPGFAVRFVVIGDRAKADEFCAKFGDATRCIPDETKITYAAMGFGQYDLSKLHTDPPLQRRRAEANAAGFKLDMSATIMDDATQLPGAAVIDGAGIVRWIFRGEHPGDLPPMSELFTIAHRELVS